MSKVVVSFGELLWDLLPGGPELGGAPANFAYRMHSLGHEAIIVSRVGQDELGRRALECLRAKGLNTEYIQVDTAHPTGTVNVTVGAKGEPDFEIVKNVAYDFIDFTHALAELARRAECICFGTLIQRAGRSRQTLAALLQQADAAKKVLDINLRKDCYKPGTIDWSLRHANILKLNEHEVVELAALLKLQQPASQLSGENRLAFFAQEIARRFALETCILTRGAEGAFAFQFEESYRANEHVYGTFIASSSGIPANVQDTCGAGDAFTAGFMHKHLAGASLQECCDYGNALGASVAETKGGTAPVTPAQIEAILKRQSS